MPLLMDIRTFLSDQAWDAPFFKVLATNDTAEAPGHQSGMYFPVGLRRYLPSLDESGTTPVSPTVDRDLMSELYIGSVFLCDSSVRYQYQTWGGTRSPEARLTNGFQPLHERARGGDIVVFQRRTDSFDVYRIILIQQSSDCFAELSQTINNRGSGVLFGDSVPVSSEEIQEAIDDTNAIEQRPFQTQADSVQRIETRQTRIARSSVFRYRVRQEYQLQCAISGIQILTPTLMPEIESAHIIPVSESGTDDIRNGFALTQSLHWAFDKGLLGVRPDRTVYIPRRVRFMNENRFLMDFEGRPIREATNAINRVHPDAFSWHMENKVQNWD